MTSHADRDIQYQKVAQLWGNSWQKLSPKQQQLVGDIMQDMKLVSVAEHLETEASKMPLPDFASVTQNSQVTHFGERDNCNSIAVTWQSVLAKTTALLTEQSNLERLQVLVRELDYLQITKNAINDICTIIRQPADLTVMSAIEAQIVRLQELFRQFFARPSSRVDASLQESIISATSTSVKYTKSLNISGLGAFVLTASLHVLLLQEKAKSEPKEWKNLSNVLNDNNVVFRLGSYPNRNVLRLCELMTSPRELLALALCHCQSRDLVCQSFPNFHCRSHGLSYCLHYHIYSGMKHFLICVCYIHILPVGYNLERYKCLFHQNIGIRILQHYPLNFAENYTSYIYKFYLFYLQII